MATIIKKNYKSDFDAILLLKSCVGDVCKEVGWPDYDWVARFYTTSHDNVYIASNVGGELTNCFNDNGNIHVVFNNHGLPSGTLRVEFSAEIPNEIYPDGSQLEISPQALNIELVRGVGDCGTIADVEVMLSYIKGDKGDAFTYDDFTAEQKADLIAPIKSDIDNAIATKQDKLSTTKDLAISASNELSLTDMAKRRLFIDMWNEAASSYGTYNEQTGFFELNGITDLTYEEAMQIYGAYRTQLDRQCYMNLPIITNLPFTGEGGSSAGTNIENAFYNCIELRNVKFGQPVYSQSVERAFCNCQKIINISGVLDFSLTKTANNAFFNCKALVNLNVKHLKISLSFLQSLNLSYQSLRYLVDNASNTSAITINVHPDVYAKLTGDTTNEAAAALTAEELAQWQQVVTDATAKQISFATV